MVPKIDNIQRHSLSLESAIKILKILSSMNVCIVYKKKSIGFLVATS